MITATMVSPVKVLAGLWTPAALCPPKPHSSVVWAWMIVLLFHPSNPCPYQYLGMCSAQ